MSTKVAKPNGMFYMKDENVEEFMKTKSVRDLPGMYQMIVELKSLS